MKFWPFNIFKRKEDTSEYIADVNLDDWHYLGFTEIIYTDRNTKEKVSQGVLHAFVHKKTNKRDYKLEVIFNNTDRKIEDHPFIVKVAKIWKAQEIYGLSSVVRDPSEYLLDYMAERGYEFSEENEWVPIIDEDKDKDPPISNDKERQ